MRPCNPTAIGLTVCPVGGLTTATRCPRCERVYQQRRNAQPERLALYDSAWRNESRAIRKRQPWCSTCGATDDLTVDHMPNGGRQVLCRKHHALVEAQRKRETRASR